jgi:RNA polymerase subunit RPABC4/transcription elongation factor Spt4
MSDASEPQRSGSAEGPDEHSAHLGPVDACPECGGHDFTTENRDDTVVFVCVGCHIAWRYELSYIWPVTTETET